MEVIRLAQKVVPRKMPRYCIVDGSVVEREDSKSVTTLKPQELQELTAPSLARSEVVVAVQKDLSAFDFSMDTTADDSWADRLSRHYLSKTLDLEQVSPRAATAPARSTRVHPSCGPSRMASSRGFRVKAKKGKKTKAPPSLDQLLSTAKCGPAQLSSMLLKDRGKVGSCGASRNIKIS
mmetsp:Transcript_17702/g.30002  ORF Transcript_17702/g.30002 Transcript_17702/m.30002 type:complete len:179 (-) Transcript_17702:58-594(-)